MLNRIAFLFNLGTSDSLSIFDQRRIRMINAFALISILLIIIFGATNLLFKQRFQGLILLSGLIYVSFPPLYFNHKKKYLVARHYFTLISISFVALTSFNAIITGHARYNEIFLVGFSAFIIIVFEKGFKVFYFVLCCILALAMVTTRRLYFDLPMVADTFLSFVNVITSFLCVYFFTSVYKTDLIKSNKKLQLASKALETHRERIIKHRDEIEANKQFLRAAIDNIPVFIALLDMHGVYLIANATYEKTFNIPIPAIEGKHYQEVLPPNIVKVHKKYINKGFKGKEVEFEEPTLLPNGTSIEVFGKYMPVFDAQQKQVGLAVYVVDISKLKATEAQLIDLNESKNRLLSLISHDIRSPLQSLNGLINLSEHMDEGELKPLLKKVADKLALVNFNLDNLLNWAKAQMDGFSIQPETVNLKKLVTNSIDLYSEKLKAKNLSIEINNLKESDLSFIDKESIKLVLRNILRNAIKFSPNNRMIDINTHHLRHFIRLEIQNEGECMSKEKIDALNQGALTLDSTVGTHGEQGTGLGLSLSLEIMKKNKGKLEIKTNPQQKTTTVILDFPLAVAEHNIVADKN